MQVCLIDEAADLGVLGSPRRPNGQPVLVIGGLFVDVANLTNLINRFLQLKRYGRGFHVRSRPGRAVAPADCPVDDTVAHDGDWSVADGAGPAASRRWPGT